MDLTLVYLVAWSAFLLVAGYGIPFIKQKTGRRICAWGLAAATTVFSILASDTSSPLFRMIAIVSLQLLAMKPIVLAETYPGRSRLNFLQWTVFATAWFGMRPILFEKLISKPLPGTLRIAFKGLSRIGVGIILLYLSKTLENDVKTLSNLLMLTGLSFILHFGILNLSTAAWRFSGVDVRELFRSPYQSKSLQEFWGKRWNLAFSEMTALIAYRPLKGMLGKNAAMVASFLLSGLLHEIAISFPVKSGYGLPFLYFVLHGGAMYAEGKLPFIQKITAHPIWSRLWVFSWLLLPMPLLFHAGFVENVMRPLREIILEILFI